MRIEERKSKKAKKGVTYRVKVDYVDEYGIKCTYSKSGFSSKAKARDHGTEMEYKLKNGLIKKESTKTLGECFLEVMELEKDKLARGTVLTYMSAYDTHIKPSKLASMPISKIDYSILQKFFNDQTGSSVLYVQKTLIKKAFKHAIRLGIVRFDPTSVVIMPKYEQKKSSTALTHEQFEAIISNINAQKDFTKYSYIVAMYCGYYLGLRISEILALEKTDFDLDRGIAYISKKMEIRSLKKSELYLTDKMKTKKSQAVLPIPNELISILKRWFDYNPYDLVCCDQNGNLMIAEVLRHAVKQAAAKVGIDFHPHLLRHTYITNVVRSGADIKTVSELARHADIQTTLEIYSHSDIQAKQQAVINAFDNVDCPKNDPKNNLMN